MNIEITAEQMVNLGKIWGKGYLSSFPAEERLAGLKPQERLAGLKPEELNELKDYLIKYKPEEN